MRTWFIFILITILSCQVVAQQSKSTGVQAAVNPADAARIAEVLAFEKEMEAAVLRGDG